MRKVKIFLLIIAMVLLTGCGIQEVKTEKLSIVCTTYPQYNWLEQIIGKDNSSIQLTLLLDNGVDMHSYQPTAKDMMMVSSANLFVYIGGESDNWAKDAIKEAVNKDMVAINLMDALGERIKTEEMVEGMQGEEEEEPENDEHIWLSLKNAMRLTAVLSDAVQKLDSANAKIYQDNTKAYLEKLSNLDKQYEQMVKNAKLDTIIVGDRFPFRYLVDDYQIHYYAAFVGCSAETEASFETITFLASKVDETNASSILAIDGSDEKIAKTIKENTKSKNQKILKLNSMQAVKKEQMENGFTYLKGMEENLTVLKEALEEGN